MCSECLSLVKGPELVTVELVNCRKTKEIHNKKQQQAAVTKLNKAWGKKADKRAYTESQWFGFAPDWSKV